MSELIIKIAGNADALSSELDKVKKQTQNLEKQVATAAKVSAVAFAGFTAVIGGSVLAFRTQEKAVNSLNQSLKNQGIFSEELTKEYQDQATALQKLTLYGDEAIIAAQASLQNQLGQTKITKE